jgi:hypothetical protein
MLTRFFFWGGGELDEACIICNENFQENESKAGVTKLPCKHHFDRECIVPWLELVGALCCHVLTSGHNIWIYKMTK